MGCCRGSGGSKGGMVEVEQHIDKQHEVLEVDHIVLPQVGGGEVEQSMVVLEDVVDNSLQVEDIHFSIEVGIAIVEIEGHAQGGVDTGSRHAGDGQGVTLFRPASDV